MAGSSQDAQTRPELSGTFGMVASTHWLGSAVGMSILETGGNAFDAAVAAGLVLQVVEPHLNGPGGDLPVLVWPVGRAEPTVLCAQGPAPAAATTAHYRDELGLDMVPGTGPLAAVVPGAFGGWMALLADFGTRSLRQVMGPAIGYARNGFPVLPQLASAIRSMEPLFRSDWAPSAEVYLPAPQAGGLAFNRALASTYERVLKEAESRATTREGQAAAAADIWYRGWVADAFVRSQRDAWLDTSGGRHSGLLSAEDLASWRPTYEAPVSTGYRGYTVYKAGPWSQGPVFLQQLRLLEGFDLEALGHGSPGYTHTVTECAKLAFADREAWYGDPAYTDVPIDSLLSSGYTSSRRALVGEAASAELLPGTPAGKGPCLPSFFGGLQAARDDLHLSTGRPRMATGEDGARDAGESGGSSGAGEPMRAELRGDTVHLDVVDRWGNMLSATPSGGWLTGAPVVRELGFCLGTRAQMFWLEDGLANSLQPGKRPRTTLSPTLVGREGAPYMAIGTPGGDQQDQWALHAFLAHVDFGLGLQAAIEAPAHHTEAFPGSFWPHAARPRHLAVEERVGDAALDALRRRGHAVEVPGPWSLGRVCAVARHADSTLRAAADPRGQQAYAAGR